MQEFLKAKAEIEKQLSKIKDSNQQINFLKQCYEDAFGFFLTTEELDGVIFNEKTGDYPYATCIIIRTWIKRKLREITDEVGDFYQAFDIDLKNRNYVINILKNRENKKEIIIGNDFDHGGKIVILARSKKRTAIEIYLELKKYMKSELSDTWATVAKWFIYLDKNKNIKSLSRKKLSETFNEYYK